MNNTPNVTETKNFIPKKQKKKMSKAGKIVWAIIFSLLLALVLSYAVTLYINSSHYAPSGLKYRITSWDTCMIVSAGKCTEEEITVPEKIGAFTVTEIGGSAFARIDGLKKVVIPETVTRVDVSVFYESEDLEEVVLPSGLTAISSNMFFGCKSLKNIDIPDSVTYIGVSAFEESGITEINIGKNIKHIDDWAFSECYSLAEIDIPGTVEKFGEGILNCCQNIEKIVLCDGIKEITNSFIYSSEKLKTFVIPKSVKYIGENVFENVSLREITYLGTLAEWNAVEKAEDWSRYIIIRCTDGAVDINGSPITE